MQVYKNKFDLLPFQIFANKVTDVSEFTKPKSLDELLADDELREFFVSWMDVTHDHVEKLKSCLCTAKVEQDIQSFLEENPILLIQHLGGGHGRWVIPKKSFGGKYFSDFMIGEKHSVGYEWQAVELEHPNSPMFTSKGDPTKELTHAIRQIMDWRSWLQRNADLASRSIHQHGLGLKDIRADLSGLILISRREHIDPRMNELRREYMKTMNISIHSYDFLLDNAIGSAKTWRDHLEEIEVYRSGAQNGHSASDDGSVAE